MGRRASLTLELRHRVGPELSSAARLGQDAAELGCGTLQGANLCAFLKWSNFPPWLVPRGCNPWHSPPAEAHTQMVGRLEDGPRLQSLPAAVQAHGSTSPAGWDCQQGIPTWRRLGRHHCPRPFPQLARGARIHPKISEGSRSLQGNHNQEQVKGRRGAEETTQHGASGFFSSLVHLTLSNFLLA